MKIPFERTIAAAYRFAFTNILSVIGVAWFPFLLVSVLTFGLFFALAPLFQGIYLQDGKTIDQARLMTAIVPLIGAGILVFFMFLLAQSMVYVGLMRKALGMHPHPVYIFFTLGSQVWRMLGAYIVLFLLIWGLGLVEFAIVGGLSLAMAKVSSLAQGIVTFVGALAGVLFYYYFTIRISFFIPAVVVAENHIGLGRSWHLGRGNFWRIFGIILVIILPVMIAFFIVIETVMRFAGGPGIGVIPGSPMTPEQTRQFAGTMMAAMHVVGPLFFLLELVLFALVAGLIAGATANAYKFVTGAAELPAEKAGA
jgi:hypothetical protein